MDFNNITEGNIYIGAIQKVKNDNTENIQALRRGAQIIGGLLIEGETYKEEAVLIKISENKYVDLDIVRNCVDCLRINQALLSDKPNSMIINRKNMFLEQGQLYVENLRPYETQTPTTYKKLRKERRNKVRI